MFVEMFVLASRGLVKVFINYLSLHHYFPVLYLIMSFDSILGSGMGFEPEKMA